MLRTNLAARRTFVRLRASKNAANGVFLLGLYVLHLFFLSPSEEKSADRIKTLFCLVVFFDYFFVVSDSE